MGMSPPASAGRVIDEVTWVHRSPYDHITSQDNLCGNQAGECTSNPLVLLCHGVYPAARGSQRANAFIRRESRDLNVTVISARTITRVE